MTREEYQEYLKRIDQECRNVESALANVRMSVAQLTIGIAKIGFAEPDTDVDADDLFDDQKTETPFDKVRERLADAHDRTGDQVNPFRPGISDDVIDKFAGVVEALSNAGMIGISDLPEDDSAVAESQESLPVYRSKTCDYLVREGKDGYFTLEDVTTGEEIVLNGQHSWSTRAAACDAGRLWYQDKTKEEQWTPRRPEGERKKRVQPATEAPADPVQDRPSDPKTFAEPGTQLYYINGIDEEGYAEHDYSLTGIAQYLDEKSLATSGEKIGLTRMTLYGDRTAHREAAERDEDGDVIEWREWLTPSVEGLEFNVAAVRYGPGVGWSEEGVLNPDSIFDDDFWDNYGHGGNCVEHIAIGITEPATAYFHKTLAGPALINVQTGEYFNAIGQPRPKADPSKAAET